MHRDSQYNMMFYFSKHTSFLITPQNTRALIIQMGPRKRNHIFENSSENGLAYESFHAAGMSSQTVEFPPTKKLRTSPRFHTATPTADAAAAEQVVTPMWFHDKQPPKGPKASTLWGPHKPNAKAKGKNQKKRLSLEPSELSKRALPEHRIWPVQDPPITDINAVPEELNWTPNDYDLDEKDIEGNIKRCQERIATGIIPDFFERKLAKYENMLAKRQEVMSREPGVNDSDVKLRLECLKLIEAGLEKKGDRYDQLPNVWAIIEAYKAGELYWHAEKMVTYWSKGEQIGRPRKFDWEDFRKTAGENDGHTGFWVEGLNGPGPTHMAYFGRQRALHEWDNMHYIEYEAAIASSTKFGVKMQFIDDTASSVTTMYADDVEMLRTVAGPDRPQPYCMGELLVESATSIEPFSTIVLALRVLEFDSFKPMTRWVYRQIVEWPDANRLAGPGIGMPRLSGSWWREMVFNGQVPDNKREMIVATTGRKFRSVIPNANRNKAVLGGESPIIRQLQEEPQEDIKQESEEYSNAAGFGRLSFSS
ncbi:hypothetical protein N7462_002315 [Penicillium macrosclerotiorum]|uniref:uncharacterized protein n=1 Tax=Penicillium macrosclerotiorum TaxID=303699 RepID=UPI002547522B|nr:uncharacterized protein N7462_002315 [Penicillium macrosclerotiorum]KAJ5692892.1 hypothetical protein N7462_002315 [Penicillium macrosclerotiorum]